VTNYIFYSAKSKSKFYPHASPCMELWGFVLYDKPLYYVLVSFLIALLPEIQWLCDEYPPPYVIYRRSDAASLLRRYLVEEFIVWLWGTCRCVCWGFWKDDHSFIIIHWLLLFIVITLSRVRVVRDLQTGFWIGWTDLLTTYAHTTQNYK
jgi:hypothetical protein